MTKGLGIRKGGFVIITWQGGGYERFLVAVQDVSTEGIRGEYTGIASDGTQVPKRDSAYTFEWGRIDNIEVVKEGFANKLIKLTDEYDAVIAPDKKSVTVGCQTITREKIKEVAREMGLYVS